MADSVSAQHLTDARALPEPGGVVAAYSSVRQWLDAFEAPKLADPAAQVPVAGGSAACVILRRFGAVVGTAVDASEDRLMVRRAAGKAMSQALARWTEGESAAARPDARATAEFGASLVLELEVAGPLTPLVGRSIEHVARKLEPGVDGVALRRDETWTLLFPSQMRATDTGGDPQSILLSLAIQADVPIKALSDLMQRDDIGLYSFRTITLFQDAPAKLPFQTYRGDTLVPLSAVTGESIARFADDVAKHILAAMWRDAPEQEPLPLGVMGNYHPLTDEYRPLLATPLEQALHALALSRYAHCAGADQATRAQAGEGARKIMADLAVVAAGEDDPLHDPVACAAIVYVFSEVGAKPHEDETVVRFVREAEGRVINSFDPASGYLNRFHPSGKVRAIEPHGQAIIAGALSRMLVNRAGAAIDVQPQAARQAIDAAWQSLPQPQHFALLPWIGWAEADYARATKGELNHADDLKAMMIALERARIGGEAPDLAGGFALTTGGHGDRDHPWATAQSVRPAAWLAGALGDARLSPTQPAEAGAPTQESHLNTIRFLMQLATRDSARAALRNPARALGGVRASLCDSSQPGPAQALALVTAVETLASVRLERDRPE